METNYYKALDVKSNSIKIREKKLLINKNIIVKFRKKEEKHVIDEKKIKVQLTVPKLLGLKYKKEYH